jgi:hypothetical protein
MILATSIIGIIFHIGNSYADYLKVELKKEISPLKENMWVYLWCFLPIITWSLRI